MWVIKKIWITIWSIIWAIILGIIWFFFLIDFLYGLSREELDAESKISSISKEQKDWWYTYDLGFKSSPKWLYSLYTLTFIEDWKKSNQSNSSIKVSSYEYPRISYFYLYTNYLYLNLKFGDWKIINRSAIDRKTKEDLWELNSIEVSEKYSFNNYWTKELEPKDSYNLSELEENVVYNIFLGMDQDLLTSINNDLGYEVIVHLKWFNDGSRGVFKPYLYLRDKKDNWRPKREEGYAEERSFMFQKATKEDIELLK